MNVLVLCHGNINRSAFCGAILAQELKGNVVKSAGFVNPGRRASKKMRDAARYHDVDLSEHRSQLITVDLFNEADFIIYMDGGNHKRLLAFMAQHKLLATDKAVCCLGDYAKPKTHRIPDPAFMSKNSNEFEEVVEQIFVASMALAKHLKGAFYKRGKK